MFNQIQCMHDRGWVVAVIYSKLSDNPMSLWSFLQGWQCYSKPSLTIWCTFSRWNSLLVWTLNLLVIIKSFSMLLQYKTTTVYTISKISHWDKPHDFLIGITAACWVAGALTTALLVPGSRVHVQVDLIIID